MNDAKKTKAQLLQEIVALRQQVAHLPLAQAIAKHHQTEALLLGQNHILELLAADSPLTEILSALVHMIEAQAPGTLGSILLLDDDGVHLRHGAAPSLPDSYNAAIDGVAIGPLVGSWGAAAYSKEMVIVTDVTQDPRWAAYGDLALAHGLRACWSIPVLSGAGTVLGTFAMYYGTPRAPDRHDQHLIHLSTHLARIAIERKRTAEALRQSEQRYRLLAENVSDVIWLRDMQLRPLYFSPSVTRLRGFSVEEAMRQSIEETVTPPSQAVVRTALALAMAKEASGQAAADRSRILELEARHKDGSTVWVEMRASFMRDATGRPVGILGVTRDIRERRRLQQEILAISEREQRRFGQELHDDLGQHLTGVGLLCQGLAQQLAARAAPEALEAAALVTFLNQAIAQTQGLARRLYPVDLETLGLGAALENLLSKAGAMSGIPCRMVPASLPVQVEPTTAIHMYRIAQEALTNAIKHSQARHIMLQIVPETNGVALIVQDDGRGLPENAAEGSGMGLRIMQYRASMIGASLDVHRLPGGGTRVYCLLPLGPAVSR